jgi:hypothetical protein
VAGGFDGAARDANGDAFKNGRIFLLCGDLWYMYDGAGARVSEFGFEAVRPFTGAPDMPAAVKSGGKWGFVDAEGEFVIPPRYDDARSFAFGLAAVRLGGRWAYIDGEGRLVIDGGFLDAGDMNSRGGALVLSGGGWQLLRLYKYNYRGA